MTTTSFDNWMTCVLANAERSADFDLFGIDTDVGTIALADFPKELERIVGEKSFTFLITNPTDPRKATLLHHLEKIKTPRGQDDIYVGLLGFGANATPVHLNIAPFTKGYKTCAPEWADLFDLDGESLAGSKEKFVLPTDPEARPYVLRGAEYDGLPFMPIPPFLTHALLGHLDDTPESIFLRVLAAARAFQAEATASHPDRFDPTESNSLRFIVAKFWTMAVGLSPAAPISPFFMPADERVLAWCADMHKLRIRTHAAPLLPLPPLPGTPTPPPAEVFDKIAQALVENTQENTAARLDREKARKEKENGFVSFTTTSKALVLHASAVLNAESVWEEITVPVETAVAFFAAKSSAAAIVHFQEYIQSCGIYTKIPPGFSSATHKGHFLWNVDDEPSNFTSLNFPPVHADSALLQSDLLLFNMKASEGKGLSDSDFDKALAQGRVVAQDIAQLIDIMEAFYYGNCFFFGTRSYLAYKVREVWKHIIANRPSYMSAFKADPLFPGRFQYRIDRGVYLFLKSCSKATTRLTVENEFVDFRTDLSEVIRGTFAQNLPPCFSTPKLKRNVLDDDKDSSKRKRPKDGSPKSDKSDRSQVVNANLRPEWELKEGESWKDFAGKNIDLLPMCGKCRACHHFHVKGKCWDDCKKAETHNIACLTPPVVTGITNYVKACRQGAQRS